MEPDYEKLGTRIGIEIHQELSTRKLFCECESSMKEDKLRFEVRRKLRAVAGETGVIDVASLYEFLRGRAFVYHGYEREACLVDIDCEPPHPVNPDALRTAVGVAKLTRLSVPDVICVMRKSITDGSSVSGFQRTILIGTETDDSFIETSNGKVKILQLSLEEDSCKIERKEGDSTYYSLSRQGIPLLEIGTDPSIKDPEHAKESALLIGTLLRSFPAVKRGIGTIRQDVNISIREGARVEVKGWQDIKTLPKLVENEVCRQASLVKIRDDLKKRGLKEFGKSSLDATAIFSHTKNKVISQLIANKGMVIALLLPGFSGLLRQEVCTGKTFGKELSEYAKAQGTKGMIHTDEDLKKYELEAEFSELGKRLHAGADDLIVIIAEQKDIAEKAISAVYDRALYALKGVPEETRMPNYIDATSSYARPLPGAHRMYPETDVLNMELAKEYIDAIELPEPLADKIKRLSREYGLEEYLAKELLKEGIDISDYAKRYPKVQPKFMAEALVTLPKEIKRRYNLEADVSVHIDEILAKLNGDEISREAVIEILVEKAKGGKVDYSKYRPVDEKHLRAEIGKIVKENAGMQLNALIGVVMGKLRGKADGKKIVEIVKSMQ